MIATKNNVEEPEAAKTTSADLKMRVLAIKGRLPINFRALVFAEFPDYDTAKGAKKLENMLIGSSSDEAITVFLETLVAPVPTPA